MNTLSTLSEILTTANGRGRTRTISEAEARNLIASAEDKVRELPADLRTKVVYQYQEGVCNSYKQAAESTAISVRFDADGNAISVNASRTYAPKRKWGRATSRLALTEGKAPGFPGGYMQI
jgi:hypothetical protein